MAEHDAGSGTPAAGPPVLAHLVVAVDGVDVSAPIRGPAVTAAVSHAVPAVRARLADVHRALIGGAVRGTGEYPVTEKYPPLQLPRSLSSTPSYSA